MGLFHDIGLLHSFGGIDLYHGGMYSTAQCNPNFFWVFDKNLGDTPPIWWISSLFITQSNTTVGFLYKDSGLDGTFHRTSGWDAIPCVEIGPSYQHPNWDVLGHNLSQVSRWDGMATCPIPWKSRDILILQNLKSCFCGFILQLVMDFILSFWFW